MIPSSFNGFRVFSGFCRCFKILCVAKTILIAHIILDQLNPLHQPDNSCPSSFVECMEIIFTDFIEKFFDEGQAE